VRRGRFAILAGLALSLPALAVGLGVAELEGRRAEAAERRLAEDRVAVAVRTLEAISAQVARASAALCEEDASVGLALVSPSGDVALDRARGRIFRLRAHGLELADVLSGSDGSGALLASSHAHGRQPFVAMPSREELARGAIVELAGPRDELPPHALVHACEAPGDLRVVAGAGLDLARDPRFAGVELLDAPGAPAGGVSLPTEIGGARRVLAVPATTGSSGLARTATVLASVVLFALGLALGAVMGGRLGGRSGRRDDEVEREVREAAVKLSRGDFDVQLHAGADSTVSAFNQMTKELSRARARAVKAERIAAWRDIARRIAHEIKNPLTPIKMAIETMRKTFARQHPDFPEIFDESTRTVLEEVERMEKIVTEFSRFARLPRPNASMINPVDVAVHVVSMHEVQNVAATNPDTPRAPRVKIDVDPAFQTPGAPRLVRADREQITQVLVNLVQNAIDAAVSKRGVEGANVLVRLVPGEHGAAVIEVHDDGPGLPVEERARVFEPYYTTKAHGTGLGLPICDRIVSDHGGTIVVDESPSLGGARFVVTLSREGPLDEADASQTV
jgi:signal transduction histidine kinase